MARKSNGEVWGEGKEIGLNRWLDAKDAAMAEDSLGEMFKEWISRGRKLADEERSFQSDYWATVIALWFAAGPPTDSPDQPPRYPYQYKQGRSHVSVTNVDADRANEEQTCYCTRKLTRPKRCWLRPGSTAG